MTKILTYTPGIQAYVAVNESGNIKTYDLTDDISTFTIHLNVDNPSRFTISLVNPNNKYVGVFNPMDRIVIYLTKIDTVPAFAGYITEAPYYRQKANEVSISGKDTLYRLQKLYWDAGLAESWWLAYRDGTSTRQDGGYWESAVRILTEVANWDAGHIVIGEIPPDTIEFATAMYQVRANDTQGADLVNEIYTLLQNTGPAIADGSSGGASSSGGAADFSGNSNVEVVWSFLISQGFTKQSAAAVIGNMQQESGVDPKKYQSGGPGRGLLQWEEGSGRFNNLCKFAKDRGTDWGDIQSQLLFFHQEAPSQFKAYTGSGKVYTYSTGAVAWLAEAMTFDQYKALTDIAWATEAFERVYTRASMPMMENRIKYAKAAYSKFA